MVNPLNMNLPIRFCVVLQIFLTFASTQQPEINDQFELSPMFRDTISTDTLITNEEPATEIVAVETEIPSTETAVTEPPTTQHNPTYEPSTKLTKLQTVLTRRVAYVTKKPNCFERIYETISTGIDAFVTTPKINSVLKNIGVCIVNGIMEIITFYVPAPFIPLIASAAGMLIPFEPVVMLRDKLPMKNYRRAVNSAVNSFLGTFDRFSVHDEDDPYMTRRFNRRFMGHSNEELSTKRNSRAYF